MNLRPLAPHANALAKLRYTQIKKLNTGKTFKLKFSFTKFTDTDFCTLFNRLRQIEDVAAFEVAGVILLVAIIAAVALTLRNRKDSKSQNIHEQVNVNSADRMRIVKMGSDMAAKQDTRGEKK